MEKNRMQKLAGIKEGTAFKNGKFKLDRFDVWDYRRHADIMKDVTPDGDFCDSIQVSKLEAIANEMYDALDDIIGEAGFEGLPDSKQDAIYAIMDKVKSL